jgi:hypothetical protein
MIKTTTLCALAALSISSYAQTFDLESITVPADKVSNGRDGKTLHTQTVAGATINMPVKWDSSFGGYWSSGWAISQKYDTTLEKSDYTKHLYSSSSYKGYNGSNTFAVGSRGAYLALKATEPTVFKTLHVTNGTYAYNSMALGDNIGKKFGGSTGNDEDSFVLVIECYDKASGNLLKTVNAILADFRQANSTTDYILKDWRIIQVVGDSLIFDLVSSDNGMFGMNTPGFFILDEIVTDKVANNSHVAQIKTDIYPNPCSNQLNINCEANIKSISITNVTGAVIKNINANNSKTFSVPTEDLSPGIYFMQAKTSLGSVSQKFIKK